MLKISCSKVQSIFIIHPLHTLRRNWKHPFPLNSSSTCRTLRSTLNSFFFKRTAQSGSNSIAIYFLSTAITFTQLYFFFLDSLLSWAGLRAWVGTQLCLIGPCGPALLFFSLFFSSFRLLLLFDWDGPVESAA